MTKQKEKSFELFVSTGNQDAEGIPEQYYSHLKEQTERGANGSAEDATSRSAVRPRRVLKAQDVQERGQQVHQARQRQPPHTAGEGAGHISEEEASGAQNWRFTGTGEHFWKG